MRQLTLQHLNGNDAYASERGVKRCVVWYFSDVL